MEIAQIVKLYTKDELSLRAICRYLGISESCKAQLAVKLRENGYEIRRGKVGLKVGDRIEVICLDCGETRTITRGRLDKTGGS